MSKPRDRSFGICAIDGCRHVARYYQRLVIDGKMFNGHVCAWHDYNQGTKNLVYAGMLHQDVIKLNRRVAYDYAKDETLDR